MTRPGPPDADEGTEGSLGPRSGEVDAREPGTVEPAADATPAARDPTPQASQPSQAAGETTHGLRGRFAGRFPRLPHPPLHSRRGWFVVIVLLVGFGAAITAVGATAVGWTETADFCGRCHTMGPELKAYAQSPHRDVACAECHVEPGVAGWIKAKLNGTRQLLLVLTGAYPAPIPAPDHADLPPTSQTCVRCHDVGGLLADGGPVKLLLDERYRHDEPNTRDTIALVVRPVGFGGESATRGVHWHIAQEVDYLSADPRAQTIDYVAVTDPSGSVKEYVASAAINLPSDVQPDIDRLKNIDRSRRVDCIDCHNRVGHGVSTPDQAVDDSMSAGRIARDLPYVKREASDRLSIEYASVEDADQAIDGLRSFYVGRVPLVASDRQGDIDRAIGDLKIDLPARRDARDEGHRYDLPEQPRPPGGPRLLPLSRRWPLPRRERRPDAENDPVCLRHLPHLPADRCERVGCPHRRAALHARRPALGVQPQERGHCPRPGRHDLRRVSHPHVLPELPRHQGGQRAARRHGLQPRRRPRTSRRAGVRLLPPAGVLRPVPRRRRAARAVPGGEPHAVDRSADRERRTMSMTGQPVSRTEWVGMHEAAAMMGVSPATLRRWSAAGDIEAFTTPGGHRRFSRGAIAGLLASDRGLPPTPDQLDRVRARLIRTLRGSSRRLAGEAPWTTAFDEDDRADIALQGRRIVDGLLAVLDERTAAVVARSSATNHAAAVCGGLAARRGVPLGALIAAGLRLDAVVVHEIAMAAQWLDLDGPSTARWLDVAACTLDHLISEAMRGHAALQDEPASPNGSSRRAGSICGAASNRGVKVGQVLR